MRSLQVVSSDSVCNFIETGVKSFAFEIQQVQFFKNLILAFTRHGNGFVFVHRHVFDTPVDQFSFKPLMES